MLTNTIEVELLGFPITYTGASSVEELTELGITSERIADIVNAYVSAHVANTKVRKTIVPIVVGYTNIPQKTEKVGDKDVVIEKDDPYVKRAIATLDIDQLTELKRQIEQALSKSGLLTLQYVAAARSATGSLTKGLKTYITSATAAFAEFKARYTKAFLGPVGGTQEELDEPLVEGETPTHIIKFAQYLKNTEAEAARKAAAGAF